LRRCSGSLVSAMVFVDGMGEGQGFGSALFLCVAWGVSFS